MAEILIKGGKIWDGEKFFLSDVLTENGKIAEISEGIQEHADFVYDAEGKIVSCGLVDAHVHMRGVSSENFAIQAEMSCFPFGVTAAADASGVFGDKSLLDSFMLKNLVFVCADFQHNRARFDDAEKMLEKYGEKAVGIKVYFDTEISDVSDIRPLEEVCKFARLNDLIVMVHSSNSPVKMAEIVETLGKGDILTHAYHGGRNTASEDDFACMERAKERGVIIDAGFAGYVHTDFRVFENAVKHGAIPDTISTDITKKSAYTRGGRYGMTLCMSIAKKCGMSEEDIFRAVTSHPANALGKGNEWGYMEVGRCADIAVFDDRDEAFDLTDKAGNRMRGTQGYRCMLTVSDGQVVYSD